VFRTTLYSPWVPWAQTASLPGLPGQVVLASVVVFFLVVTALTFWPRERRACSQFHGEEPGDWKR